MLQTIRFPGENILKSTTTSRRSFMVPDASILPDGITPDVIYATGWYAAYEVRLHRQLSHPWLLPHFVTASP